MTQFGRQGIDNPNATAKIPDAPSVVCSPGPIGLGLLLAILGCGGWWLGEYLIANQRTLFSALFMFSAMMFGLGAGVSMRVTLQRLAARQFMTSTIALLEAAACTTLLWMYLTFTYGLLSAIPWGIGRWVTMSATAIVLMGVGVWSFQTSERDGK